ncbi:MAG: VRR-NUC domain-containing protein [Dehalococcoidales bacterium]|nr:VRR-NUC domain-containing protein [Dehalococcoidales bacterium]
MLFDKQDFKIAMNQAHLGYHFFEWLAAIILYESMGLLSLVEQYEYKSHRRKQALLERIVPREVFARVKDHKLDFGRIQCPDLLAFTYNYSEWLFFEVKGPEDRISKKQFIIVSALEQAGSPPVRAIKFHRLQEIL